MGTKSLIIALVDDDTIFQYTASKILKATALTNNILQFANGDEALQFIKQHLSDVNALPDLIFLDLNMPYSDGWMFLDDFEKIKRALAKPISIFILSASIDTRDLRRAKKNTNVKGYVIKPVTREKLQELLQHAA
jgi:two-component system, chemotaxis family, chemotaxis protein CheY